MRAAAAATTRATGGRRGAALRPVASTTASRRSLRPNKQTSYSQYDRHVNPHMLLRSSMSSLAHFPYAVDARGRGDPDTVLPLVSNGFDVNLNWSLGDDGITIGGDAWRNAPMATLRQHCGQLTAVQPAAPEAASKVAKQWSRFHGAFATLSDATDAKAVASCTTDEAGPSFRLLDVDAAEALHARVCDDLYQRARLFVEDGAVGSHRNAAFRVRAITDSAELAVYFRTMLHSVPLHDASTFPRNILVIANRQWRDAEPSIVSDIDVHADGATKATITCSGRVPLALLTEHIAHCAAQLAPVGSAVRSTPGGGVRARMAQETGRYSLYESSRHMLGDGKSAPTSSSPAAVLGGYILPDKKGNGATAIVVKGPVAGASDLPHDDRLYASHAFVWDQRGVAPLFAGTTMSAKGASVALAKVAAVAADGALGVAEGSHSVVPLGHVSDGTTPLALPIRRIALINPDIKAKRLSGQEAASALAGTSHAATEAETVRMAELLRAAGLNSIDIVTDPIRLS